MYESSEFSNVARRYLCRYYEILDTMIQEMTSVQLSNSISHNFILQMIPHHRAAIEMSKNLLQYTTFVPLQNIAANIIRSQTKSIADMEAAFAACSGVRNTEQELHQYAQRFEEITQTMFADMENARAANNINADFMREMIPHHEGAIRMSRNALRFPICPALKPILEAIIVSQTQGVREMERLLQGI